MNPATPSSAGATAVSPQVTRLGLGDLATYLNRQKEKAQSHLMGIAIKELMDALGRSDDRKLIGFAKFLARAARTEHHRAQLRQLVELWENDHPSLGIARKLFNDIHPNCRTKLIYNLGVLGVWQGEIRRREFKRVEGHRPPFLGVISPTNRCNLKCTGCYSGLFPRDVADPMSWEVFDRIITDSKELGIHFFTITGGEPFVRNDVLDMFEKHSDCIFHVYTNGTRITDKHVDRIVQLGNVLLSMSVEGFREQTNERRGRGVWESVMETMDRLRSAGCIFGFSATATRLNADVIASEEFIDLMIDKGCLYGWQFIMTPTGKDDDPYFMPTPAQRDRLRAHAMDMRRKKPIFIADFWNDACLTDGCMSAGTLYFHINFKGDIEPCVFVHFAEQNVFELYRNGGHLKDAILHGSFFKALRTRNRRDPNRLRPCPILDHNEYLEESIVATGAYPTHVGAEAVITDHREALRTWGEAYGELAEKAWNSGEYNFFKNASHLWLADEDDWAPGTVERLRLKQQGGCQNFNHSPANGNGCGVQGGGNGNGHNAHTETSRAKSDLIELTV